jgi:DNA primase
VLGAADLGTAEGRAKAAEETLRAVAEHPNDLVRDQYLMLVADRCRLDAAALRPLLERLVRDISAGASTAGVPAGRRSGVVARAPGADADRPRAGEGGHPGAERDGGVPGGEVGGATAHRGPGPRGRGGPTRSGLEALRLAVHHPELVVDRLEPVLFADPVQRAAFVALVDHDDLHLAVDAAERADPDVARLLRQVTVEEPAGDADDVIVLLVRNATRRALGDIEAQARLSPEALGDLASVAAVVRGDLEELDDPAHAVAASERLLAWLVGRGEESR